MAVRPLPPAHPHQAECGVGGGGGGGGGVPLAPLVHDEESRPGLGVARAPPASRLAVGGRRAGRRLPLPGNPAPVMALRRRPPLRRGQRRGRRPPDARPVVDVEPPSTPARPSRGASPPFPTGPPPRRPCLRPPRPVFGWVVG